MKKEFIETGGKNRNRGREKRQLDRHKVEIQRDREKRKEGRQLGKKIDRQARRQPTPVSARSRLSDSSL